ncbi:hypothetical protein PF005_g25212 [Phytophthora fragariae]|uniref:Uncharacterized protein n=1 Tax=Phytophthora fragariae TaxID=53985 RepID=A0A6A3I897_9STRA|nr:hypothetical protein PF003_g28980 [Phytophthora fragariae]KAE8976498.1 hypothetical protein PF011_g24028 [Phytophthora fragariae]KAE9074304.1 hypothetical protein PF010_g24726 [Phytophthora fragariae]KAE9092964.1 hypothetical protein PF006_g24558 [Phytophthora fragariae]KAE9175882.1 hypothetical protein PF005_g25212 [Phytophthora fragariae]
MAMIAAGLCKLAAKVAGNQAAPRVLSRGLMRRIAALVASAALRGHVSLELEKVLEWRELRERFAACAYIN